MNAQTMKRTVTGGAGTPRVETLVHAFLDRVHRTPARVAYARKRLGLWKETTWSECAREVAQAVSALRRLGLERDDTVAVMGDARDEFVIVLLACQFLGLRCAPLYPSTDVSGVRDFLTDLAPRLVIGEDDEDIFKFDDAGLESVKHVAILAPRSGLRAEVRVWAELLEQAGDAPADLNGLAGSVTPGDIAYIAFTSGAADTARPVAVTHANAMAAWTGACSVLPPIDHRDRVMVDAPLAHPAGQAAGLVLPVLTGCVAFFVEDPAQAVVSAIEVRPTVSIGTPRRWLRMWRQVRAGIAESSWLKRHLFDLAFKGRGAWAGRALASVVCRPLLRKIGANRLRVCLVGWAALPPGLAEFWDGVGIRMRELYGLTESAGVVAISAGGDENGALTTVVPGIELRLADDNEVLVRGPQICAGYLVFQGELTPATDADGWLHTHDRARRRRDGSLVLVGRLEGVLVLDDGRRVQAEELESVLRTNPYITEAIAYVGADAQLRALVELDLASVADWARSQGMIFTASDELSVRDEVQELIRTELDGVNAALRERDLPAISSVDISPEPFGLKELTPTRRIRGSHRRVLGETGVGAGSTLVDQ